MPKSKIKNEDFYLNKGLLNEFRNTINSTNIFQKTSKLKEKYNLICVVMDRLDSAIGYLNEHEKQPKTEEDFVCFLVYACMIRDGIMKLYENVFQRKPSFIDDKKFFRDVKIYSKNAFSEDDCPTDDVFFEYLRSMAFAHPFNTGNRKGRFFLESNEIQYCPWVIVRDNYVGIRVYTSSDKFVIQDLTFDFYNLKAYIKSIYERLDEINIWARDEILLQDQEWAKKKIDRTGTINDLIQNIKNAFAERFLEPYDIECIETYLTCETTNFQNKNIVESYREELTKSLYKICDALDEVDNDALDEATNIIGIRPRNAHSMMYYQLEKIFGYLDNDHGWMDVQWGLRQAQDFANEFATKWVVIEIGKMDFSEIKLLVTIACYFEAKEQGLLKEV